MTNYLVLGIIITIFLIGAATYWNACTIKAKRQLPGSRLKKYKSYLVKEFRNAETDNLVRELGLNISGLTFQFIRYSILIIWLIWLGYKKYFSGADIALPMLLWLTLFFISSPRRSFFTKESPFLLILSQIRKHSRHKYNLEIYRALSQLKNLAVAKADFHYSADYIICELAKYTIYTRPIFNRMLGYWYEGCYEEACKYFTDTIDTEDAKALASLLSKIDYLKPVEFISQLELYQNDAKERRKTAAQKAKENRSNLIYSVVIISSFLIMVNFIIVSIAIDAFEYYKQLMF